MKEMKKVCAYLLAIAMVIGSLVITPAKETYAASATLAQCVEALKAIYPSGSQWVTNTHKRQARTQSGRNGCSVWYIAECYSSASMESERASWHTWDGKTLLDYTNADISYDSLAAIPSQCYGFAMDITYRIYGSSWNNWGTTSTVHAGDVIYYPGVPHAIFVTSLNADGSFQYVDCNDASSCEYFTGESRRGQCFIRWDKRGTINDWGTNHTIYHTDSAINTNLNIKKSNPVIYNVTVKNVTDTGYDISCNIKSENGINRVMCPTWTVYNGQDDLASNWSTNNAVKATVSGNTATFHVNTSDHKNEKGWYATHIYAYDNNGNSSAINTIVYVGSSEFGSDVTVVAKSFLNGKEYDLLKMPLTFNWTEASAYAQSRGYTLPCITSKEENDLVLALSTKAKGGDVFLGANDVANEGTWTWMSGESFTYKNWGSGQPDNDQNAEHYLTMFNNGQWNDATTAYKQDVLIIERPIPSNTITFVPNGGTIAGSATYAVKAGSTLNNDVAAANPTRAKHTFLGWYTDPVGGTKVYDATGKYVSNEKYFYNGTWNGSADCVLYGHWEFNGADSTAWTEWSTTKPTNVAENLIDVKTEYRSTNTETFVSSNETEPGCTCIGSEWKTSSTGNLLYVKQWPAGYPTNTSFSAPYMNTPKQASTTASSKTEVSEAIAGYIYYHWCRGTYSDGPINRWVEPSCTGEFNAFHAFFTTISPSSLNCDTQRMEYEYGNPSCCRDSHWYYAIPVYKQTYTISNKQYKHVKWGEPSEWSAVYVTDTANTKAETRTLYRAYIEDPCVVHGHKWQTTATVQPTYLKTGSETKKCSVCGTKTTTTLPVLDLPFTDVKLGGWHESTVRFMLENKLMSGKTATTFDPSSIMNRGQLVSILWSMEGKPKVSGTLAFTDVPTTNTFYKAILWASQNKVVNGYSTGEFKPKGELTREQIATILMNYAKFKGITIAKKANLTSFQDVAQINRNMVASMQWAVGNKIISGKNSGTLLDPKGMATRIEVAAMVMNYCKNIK